MLDKSERLHHTDDTDHADHANHADRSQIETALDLYVVLSRASTWVEAHAIRDIRSYDLNPTEFGILEALYHKGPLPLQQLGEKVLISSGNITYAVDKLEQKCLLARKPSQHDRRVIYAELTPQGGDLLASIFPKHELVIQQAVSGLSREEQLEATRLLKKLGVYAQESYEKLT